MRTIAFLLALTATASAQQYSMYGGNEDDRLAYGVAGLGDVDGDGAGDIAVRTGWYSGDVVWICSGRSGARLRVLASGNPESTLGAGGGLANAYDADGDGVDDVLLTDTNQVATHVSLYSGATGLVLQQFPQLFAGDYFGYSVAGVGDVNGDGRGDVLIGLPLPVVVGTKGQARLYDGATGGQLNMQVGAVVGEQFGHVVGRTGDADNDGTVDFAVASLGGVRIVSGATGATIRTIGQSGIEDIDGAGDVDQDGSDDVLLGKPAFFTTGAAYVYSGATGAQIRQWGGAIPNTWFGAAVAGLGDVDADGVPDVAVGAPTPVGSSAIPGSVHVFSGATSALLFSRQALSPATRYGAVVDSVGDLTGDGRRDLLVAESQFDSAHGNRSGKLHVLESAGPPCPGAVVPYGKTCVNPGPDVFVTGCPTPGGEVALGLFDTKPSLLLIGVAPQSLPVKNCVLRVDPTNAFFIPLPAFVDASIPTTIPLGVPSGAKAYLQLIDASIPTDVTPPLNFSNAVEVDIR